MVDEGVVKHSEIEAGQVLCRWNDERRLFVCVLVTAVDHRFVTLLELSAGEEDLEGAFKLSRSFARQYYSWWERL